MQRQRGELVPVAEALADLPGPVQALIPSPPIQRHFTLNGSRIRRRSAGAARRWNWFGRLRAPEGWEALLSGIVRGG